MKKYIGILICSIGMIGFLSSCECKTCKKDNEPIYTICKDQGSQENYDNTIIFLEAGGFNCE